METAPYPDIPNAGDTVFGVYAEYWEQLGAGHVNPALHRPAWILCFLVGSLASLTGNALILYAAGQRAINLDKVTTTLIQHVAVSDLLNTLLVILPTLLTVAADRWLLGRGFCNLRAYLQVPLQTYSMLLVCALNCAKLAFIIFPLRADGWRARYGHAISLAMMMIASIPLPISIVLVRSGYLTPMFNFESITCEFMLGPHSGLTSLYAAINFFLIVGCTTLVLGTTTWLVFVAKKTSKSRGDQLKKRGLVTVISIAVLYSISFLPVTAVYVVFLMGQRGFRFSPGFYNFLLTRGRTTAIHIIYLNNTANVFIYFASIASFRQFLLAMLRRVTSRCFRENRIDQGVVNRSRSDTPRPRFQRRETETVTLGSSVHIGIM